jgi:hypothetical protein
MIRGAILRELQSLAGTNEPPPANKVQQIARALCNKAGQGDVPAFREILNIDGKSAGGLDDDQPRQVNVKWEQQSTS